MCGVETITIASQQAAGRHSCCCCQAPDSAPATRDSAAAFSHCRLAVRRPRLPPPPFAMPPLAPPSAGGYRLPPWALPLPPAPLSSSGSVLPLPDSPPPFRPLPERRARQAAHTTLNTRERGLRQDDGGAGGQSRQARRAKQVSRGATVAVGGGNRAPGAPRTSCSKPRRRRRHSPLAHPTPPDFKATTVKQGQHTQHPPLRGRHVGVQRAARHKRRDGHRHGRRGDGKPHRPADVLLDPHNHRHRQQAADIDKEVKPAGRGRGVAERGRRQHVGMMRAGRRAGRIDPPRVPAGWRASASRCASRPRAHNPSPVEEAVLLPPILGV